MFIISYVISLMVYVLCCLLDFPGGVPSIGNLIPPLPSPVNPNFSLDNYVPGPNPLPNFTPQIPPGLPSTIVKFVGTRVIVRIYFSSLKFKHM